MLYAGLLCSKISGVGNAAHSQVPSKELSGRCGRLNSGHQDLTFPHGETLSSIYRLPNYGLQTPNVVNHGQQILFSTTKCSITWS